MDVLAEERKHYRPSWDDYFMAIVMLVATRGTCDRLYTAAVLVKNNRIISTGYNGAPQGLPHCQDIGHMLEGGHCVRTVHGELNALLQVAVQGCVSVVGSTMYTKYSPCIHCSKYIVTCGVKRVVIGEIYRNKKAIDYLKDSGVDVVIYEKNLDWDNEIIKIFSEGIIKRVNDGNVEIAEKKII